MKLLRTIWDNLFTNPVERKLRRKLSEGYDGIVLLEYGSRYPGAKTIAEWKRCHGVCTLSWAHFAGRNDREIAQGERKVDDARFSKLVARLDELDQADINCSRGKDTPWYSAAWLSRNGQIRSFLLDGSLLPGHCAEVIGLLCEDIPKAPAAVLKT
jgi:hypothetical protein